MADIFISYKAERRAAAEHLCRTLECYGYSVWFDYGLLSGDEAFRKQIEREIRAAGAVLVLWCPLANESRWVGEEASLSLELNKYVGVLIDGNEYPFGYREAHNIDLRNWDGNPRSSALDRLIDQIRKKTGKRPSMDWEQQQNYSNIWSSMGALSLAQFRLITKPVTDVQYFDQYQKVIGSDQHQNFDLNKSRAGVLTRFKSAFSGLLKEKFQVGSKSPLDRFKGKLGILSALGAMVLTAIAAAFFLQPYVSKKEPVKAVPPIAQATSPQVKERSTDELDRMLVDCRGDSAKLIPPNPQKCFELGRIYETGNLTEKNLSKAAAVYVRGCQQKSEGGSKASCGRLGVFYGWGMIVKKDHKLAKDYLVHACNEGSEGGDLKSCGNLGVLHLLPDFSQKSDEIALKYMSLGCKDGATDGSAHSCSQLGHFYFNSISKKDLVKSNHFHDLACRNGKMDGEAISCAIVAANYGEGLGIGKDTDKENQFLSLACREGDKSGHAPACWNLGLNYLNARGFDQDYVNARRFYEKGCREGREDGFPPSCFAIGLLYINGHGVERDTKKAQQFFQFGCRNGNKLGDSASCFQIGLSYSKGDGVPMNRVNAKRYYEIACREGDISGSAGACNNLALIFEKPTLDAVDYKSAEKYYDFACRKGDRFGEQLGCNNLGNLYYDGRGVEQSFEKAKQYYLLACRNGDNGGNHHACYRVGEIYEKNKVSNSSLDLAISFYRKSHALNEYYQAPKEALVRLGVIAEKSKK